MVAEIGTDGIIKLTGNSEGGKSSYILAVMLGMGFDICLDYKDATTTICGLDLKSMSKLLLPIEIKFQKPFTILFTDSLVFCRCH